MSNTKANIDLIIDKVDDILNKKGYSNTDYAIGRICKDWGGRFEPTTSVKITIDKSFFNNSDIDKLVEDTIIPFSKAINSKVWKDHDKNKSTILINFRNKNILSIEELKLSFKSYDGINKFKL